MVNINLNPSPNPNTNLNQHLVGMFNFDGLNKDLIGFRAWIKNKFGVLRTWNYYQ